jgi:hypothetical protein
MPNTPIDPASLEGEALASWYQRSPWEVEQERQAAAAQRYISFFGGGSDTDPDPGFDVGRSSQQLDSGPAQQVDSDPAYTPSDQPATHDFDPSITWVASGPNRWRKISTLSSETAPAIVSRENSSYSDPILDRSGAGAGDGAHLIDIGNPANRKLRQQYEQTYGPWPKTADGRNYDVAHTRAIADGGTNTLENVKPMHPDAHVADHMANGDPARWARRAGIARAFGGTVARVLGPFSILSDVTGMLSGRIRTDSSDNFSSDMMGLPSREDRLRALENEQRRLSPNWKMGDPIVTIT